MSLTIEDAAAPQPLAKMRALAEKIAATLRPYCARVEIAGSIRRERPMCGDIDLVILPHPAARRELEREIWLISETGGILTNGKDAKRLLLRKSRVQCDLWLADMGREAGNDLFNPIPPVPGNWGALLATYTGSVQHNIDRIARAQARGWRWSPTRGLQIPQADGSVEIVSLMEEAIYERLYGKWITPQDRQP